LQHSAAGEVLTQGSLRLNSVLSVIEVLGIPVLLADRSGRIVIANQRAQTYLDACASNGAQPNLFRDLLRMDAGVILGQLEDCQAEARLQFDGPSGTLRAHVHSLPDTQWLVVRM
jgi:signal transduction histidine kinase